MTALKIRIVLVLITLGFLLAAVVFGSGTAHASAVGAGPASLEEPMAVFMVVQFAGQLLAMLILSGVIAAAIVVSALWFWDLIWERLR